MKVMYVILHACLVPSVQNTKRNDCCDATSHLRSQRSVIVRPTPLRVLWFIISDGNHENKYCDFQNPFHSASPHSHIS